VSDGKRIYVINDCDFPELWAIKPDGKGNVTGSHIAWKLKKNMPQRASVLLVKDLIFAVSHKGYVVCVDTATGKSVWREKIGKAYSASPLHAENRVYLFSERAGTTVIEPGRTYKPLATNKLDGRVMASPAGAGKALFIRTDTHLYRIEE
jgi:outer membrane protein assembly factor BamB